MRWWIVRAADRLPGQCWTDLVAWAQRDDSRPLLPWSPVVPRVCLGVEAGRGGRCYCGKYTGATARRAVRVLGAAGRVAGAARSVWRRWRPDELARLVWASVAYAREDNRARALRQQRRKADGR